VDKGDVDAEIQLGKGLGEHTVVAGESGTGVAVQNPRFGQNKRSPTQGDHEFRLRAGLANPFDEITVLPIGIPAVLAAGHDENIDRRSGLEAVVRDDSQPFGGRYLPSVR
jgi:hypothetical protein